MAISPGNLAAPGGLNPTVPVSRSMPPTFLVQAENDSMDGVEQSLVYHTALARASVPVEMPLYAHGGHAFDLRPTLLPITGWPELAKAWMQTIGMSYVEKSALVNGIKLTFQRPFLADDSPCRLDDGRASCDGQRPTAV